MHILELKSITLGSLFKIILTGLMVSLVPFFTALGILAAFGLPTLSYAGVAVTGAQALIMGPLEGVIFALLFSVLTSPFVSIGFWLLNKFTDITLSVKVELDETA